MDKWLKLHLVKRFVNLAVRVLNRMIPHAEPTQPQTKALCEIYKSMYKAFSVETYCGTFDDVSYQKIASLKDRNFQHALELSEKLLTYLGEMDRYYRGWLGLALLLSADQVKETVDNLEYHATLESIRVQWDYPLNESFVSKGYFEDNKQDFLEILFTFGLSDLARFQFGKSLFSDKITKPQKQR